MSSDERSRRVRQAFAARVSEIIDGTVVIERVVSEERCSKVAVYSKDLDVDAVGACVGMKGERVREVIGEVGGSVDVIEWAPNSWASNVMRSLTPIEVASVEADEDPSLPVHLRGAKVFASPSGPRTAAERAAWTARNLRLAGALVGERFVLDEELVWIELTE